MKMNKKGVIGIIFIILGILLLIGIVLYFATRSAEPDFGGDCGNQICEFGESTNNCPQDCPNPSTICGDGICESNELCESDCGNNPIPEFCGDTICQEGRGETKNSCPDDCGLPLPECGNDICQVFNGRDIQIDEFLSCPSDCGIICGDGECVIDPYDERINCPSDCNFQVICGNDVCQEGESTLSCPTDCKERDFDNDDLIFKLNQKQRPLVGGLSLQHERAGNNFALCSLGAIVRSGGTKYILTAGHCVTKGEDGFPDPVDIGLLVKQGDEEVGRVFKTDFTGGVDGALISINSGVSSRLENFLGDEISGFGSVFEGQKVFKIGRTTGLTFGTVTDTNIFYTDSNGNRIRGYEVTGDNGKFSESGDSGSAIITVSKPHKIVGIISAGSGSNLPEDIKSRLNID